MKKLNKKKVAAKLTGIVAGTVVAYRTVQVISAATGPVGLGAAVGISVVGTMAGNYITSSINGLVDVAIKD